MQKPKVIGIGLLSLLVLVLIGLVWQAAAQGETIPFGETQTQELEGNQANRWVFEANRNDILQFDLKRLSGDLEATLTVRDRNGETQLQLNASPNIESFVYRVPQFGEYNLEISPQNSSAGSYEITLQRLEVGLREFEQGRIAYGQSLTQEINDSIPYHLWSFTGREGEVIDLRMRVTDGDLRPVITLTSPGGDVIASQSIATRRRDGDLEARLLAFRLPGNGTYRISARRAGENLGFSGNTEGRYELNLSLRNGSQATANVLRPGNVVEGRLTLDSPIALYEIIDPRRYIIQVEFSEANCLVDLAITDRGIAVLEAHQGRSPFFYALEVPVVIQPILELKSSHCPNPERIEYQLSLIPINQTLPYYYLPINATLSSTGQAAADRWFFPAKAGDIITLEANPKQLQTSTNIRLIAPNQEVVYRGRLYPNFSQQLWLKEDGLYSVQVESRNTPYDLAYHLVGEQGSLYQLQTPISTQFLDISEPSIWQVLVENRSATSLVIEAPNGDFLSSSRSTDLNHAVLEHVLLPQMGRYVLKVFSETRPQNIRTHVLNNNNLILRDSLKGTLTSPLARELWLIPNSPEKPFDLSLEILTANLLSPPELVVLDQHQQLVEPEFIINNRNGISLYQLPASAGNYQVMLSRKKELSYTDYRLTLNQSENPATLSATSLPAPSGFESPVLQNTAQSFWLASPIENTNANLFENAVSLGLPSQNRIELQAEQDIYLARINIQRNQLLTLEALHIEGQTPPGITLLDENRQIVAERWEREAPTNLLYYRTPRGGRYYIALTGDPQGGRYLLNIGTSPNIDEKVPQVESYFPLQLGENYQGAFTSRQETRTYAFWGIQGSEILIETLYELGDLSPNLELISPSRRSLIQAEFDPETYNIRTNPVRLPETGFYQLILKATPISRDLSYSRFRLQTYILKGELLTEGLLEKEVVSTLGLEKQSSTWLFEAQSNELLNFHLEPLTDGPSPLNLSISDTLGNQIYQRSTNLSVNQIIIRDLMLPRKGLYRITISGGNALGGVFRLKLERQQSFVSESDYPLGYGQSRQRTFNPENRLDRWVLAGNQGDVIALSLRYERGDAMNIGLQLENEKGELLYSSNSLNAQNGLRGDNIKLPQTGIYSITVGTLDPEAAGEMVYRLSVELQNQIQRRNTNGLLRLNETQTGILFAHNASNYWVFNGQAGQSINLNLEGDGQFEPAFDLYPFGTLNTLTRTGSLQSPAALSGYILPQTGSYIVKVSGLANQTGSYRLNLSQNTLPTPISAILRPGESYNTSLQRGQATTWELQVQQGDEVSFRLDIPRRSSLEPQLKLLADDGTILWIQNTDRKSLSIENYRLPQNGTYRLEISTILGEENIPNNSEYTLFYQKVNNTTSRLIRPLSYNNSGIGELIQSNRSNLWSFVGQAGDAVTLQGTRTSGDLDLILTLTSPEGIIIAQDDDSLGNLDAEIQSVLPSNGEYLVEIKTVRDHVIEVDNNYRLDLRLNYRPAQNANLTNSIHYGQRLVGSFDPLTAQTIDVREWVFSGQNGDKIEAIVQFPSNDSPLRMFLLDGAGQNYLQGERISDRTLIRGFELPADGLYTLRLERSPDNRNTTSYYPYSLALNLLDSQALPSEGAFIVARNSKNARLGEIQTWFYDGQANEQIILSLNPISAQAIRVTVLSPNRQILQNNGAEGYYHLPYDGIYQIILQNPDPNQTLDYQIYLASQATETPILRQLIPYQRDLGNLSPQAKRENWVFEGEAGASVFIQIQADSPNLIDWVELSESNGVVLALGQNDPSGRWILSATLPNNDVYTLSVAESSSANIGTYQILMTPDFIHPQFVLARPLSPYSWQAGNLAGNDLGVYSFWAEANTPVAIATRSSEPASTIHLEILDSTGQSLLQGGNEIQNFYPPANAYYLLRASHPTPIRYETLLAPRPNQNAAPDARIGEIRPQVNLSSTLSPDFRSELWSLDGNSGDTILISVEDFSLSVRHDLILFDPEGQPIRSALEAPSANRVSLGPVLLPLDGIYTLRVGAWLGETSRNPSQYTLRVDPVPDTLGSDGGQIAVLGQPVWGGVNSADSSDLWTFTGAAGSSLNLQLDNGLSSVENLKLELATPDGIRLNLGAQNLASVENIFLPLNGTYRLRVFLESDDLVERPLIYRLVVSETLPDLKEILSQAQSISPDSTLSSQAERQTWVFYASAGETFSVQTESESPLRLMLIDPQGHLQQGSYTGGFEPTLFKQTGFYGIVVENPSQTNYNIQVKRDTLRSKWRWSLQPDNPVRAILSLGAPIHEWNLNGQTAGEYQMVLRPTQSQLDLRAYLQDENGEILTLGLQQDDGTIRLQAYLQDKAYQLIVTAAPNNLPSAYDIVFEIAHNNDSPKRILTSQAQSGEITPLNTIDEWIWQSERQTLLTLNLEKTFGSAELGLRIYAPGNLLLSEYEVERDGIIQIPDLLIPVEGTYIIQVIRTDEVTTATQANYVLTLTEKNEE